MAERKITRTCKRCGACFSVIPSRLKHGRGLHCSPSCQYESRRMAVKNASALYTCLGCGKQFEQYASRVTGRKGGGKYCTRECMDLNWRGPLNPLWQNGAGVYKRGSDWQAIRRRILVRDKVCQCCGSDGSLHVHHVIPFRMFDDHRSANDETNLVALCPPCHRRADARHKWVRVGSGAIQMNAGGYAWDLAQKQGLV